MYMIPHNYDLPSLIAQTKLPTGQMIFEKIGLDHLDLSDTGSVGYWKFTGHVSS